MLRISARWSDQIILTMDNLGGVDVNSLLAEMQEYTKQIDVHKCIIIEDRTEAIAYAWKYAEHGDQVAITGKGRELYEQAFALPCMTDPQTIELLLNRY